MLGDMGNKRGVRILLECILVLVIHIIRVENFIGGSLESHLWLFSLLGGGRDLQVVFCHSMNAGSVVGIP